MKKRFLIILCAVAGFLSLAASESAVAGVSWSVSVFDGPLGSCGHWIERPGYGRCWYPAYVSSDWRPYCEGYWMWTDSGWYWVSDEQWAWATYHYGRWDYDSYYGWVWVPDTEWGPSWVSWREGDEYVGWAPLPPRAGFGPGGYVVVRDRPIQDRFFVFVGIGHFAEPVHRRTVIVNKTTVINKTVNITNITRVNNVVVNNGPKFESIQKVNTRRLTEPPPKRVAEDHPAVRRTGEPAVGNPSSDESAKSRAGDRPGKHETEIIRGTPGRPAETTGSTIDTGKQQGDKKHVETPPVQFPTPAENKSDRLQGEKDTTKGEPGPSHKQQQFNQNPDAKPSAPHAPAAPDSAEPKEHKTHTPPPEKPSPRDERSTEKRSQSHEDEGKGDRSKKNDSGGN